MLDNDEITILKEVRILIPIQFNENSWLKKVEKNHLNENQLNILVETSYNCQLSCQYCYNSSKPGRKRTIDFNKLNNDIITKVEQEDIINVGITWSGGEPLLAFEGMIKSILELRTKLNRMNVHIYNDIITNGYELNEHIFKKILEEKINSVQLSINGYSDYLNGDFTEWRYNSLRYLSKLMNKGIDTRIYCHVDSQTLKIIPEIISKLNMIDNFNIHFILLKKDKSDRSYLSYKDYCMVLPRLYSQTKKNNYRFCDFEFICSYNRKNTAIVSPELMYRRSCTFIEHENVNIDKIESTKEYGFIFCESCEMLPICNKHCKWFFQNYSNCFFKQSVESHDFHPFLFNHFHDYILTTINPLLNEVFTWTE